MFEERMRLLRDADRKGMVLIMPCKMGETFYRVISKDYSKMPYDKPYCNKPMLIRTHFIKVCQMTEVNAFKAARDYGVSTFSTLEEAEAEMKRRKEADEQYRNSAVS